VRIAALVERVDHVCCRYRLQTFAPLWQSAGHTLDLLTIPSGPYSQFQFFRSLSKYDAVIIQRLLPPVISIKLLKAFTRQLIYDFDDAVWLRDSYHPSGLFSRKRLRRFQAIINASDVVVAGNPFLAAEAEKYHPGSTVIIPTSVDPSKYSIRREKPIETCLVWVGSASTLTGLEQVRDLLDTVGRKVPDIYLKIICDKPLTLDNLRMDFVPWKQETETTEISEADIGIAWMPDDDWSRGKCGLKVVQYLAAGLPVVANRVGVHEEMVLPSRHSSIIRTFAMNSEIKPGNIAS
jgi:glycosyltransferase involved in cell wall biosynthesis